MLMTTSNLKQLFRPQFILLVLCVLGYFSVRGFSGQVDDKMNDESIKNYDAKWKLILDDFKKGTPVEKVRSALPSQAKFIGVATFGGTGRQQWIFRIDDFSEIVIYADINEKLIAVPFLQRQKKWLTFPDGTILCHTE